ncbi:MAG: hypothetical protein OXH76_01255 [Boseongicola sp.]|nr:hypothetical protein [Boseongicola sp.]
MSFKKAEPVRSALGELWQLKPDSSAPRKDTYEIRQHPAFQRLFETCRDAYSGSGERGLDSALVEALLSLGFPAGLPPDLAHLALPVEEAARTLDAALRATETRRFHLAPLDVALRLPEFSFGQAKICSPKLEGLAELVDLPRLKRRFGRDQDFGVAELSQFQWLIVEETGTIDRAPGYRSDSFLRLTGPDGKFRVKDHTSEALERIEPHKSRHPKAFEDALFFLVLLPWEDWTSRKVTWRGFSIPWVLTVDDDIFTPPKPPPPPDSLTWGEQLFRDQNGAEEWVNCPVRLGTLDKRATSCLTRLTSGHWSRVLKARESALFKTPVAHFLVRGFDTEGIDEFLAHITTIEAALGNSGDRSGGSTKILGTRIGHLLDDASCGDTFKSLFQIRCEFVHGRKGMKDISSEDRRAARRLARRVTSALIRRANRTKVSSREDFLEELASEAEEAKLPKATRRVQDDASAARAFFRTWKALDVARGDAGLLATMNDHRHADFFITTMDGCFRLVFQSLGKMFDRNQRTASLGLLSRRLSQGGHGDLAQELEGLLSEHGGTIKKIMSVKGKSVDHDNLASANGLLEDAGVSRVQIEELIDESCRILNRIGARLGLPERVSEGERYEQAAQHLLETLRDSRLPKTQVLGWDQVREFFEEHGCVAIGHPEIRWYREAWDALDKAGLTSTTEFQQSELAQTALKLRAICLLVMYLGMYQAAGSHSGLGGHFNEHEDVSLYLDSLGVQMQDVWQLACASGFLETDATTFWDDEETDDGQLAEIAMDLVRDENRPIFDALVEHHDGNIALFVSLWNSRVPPEDAEPVESVVDPGQMPHEKLDVWAYVEERMQGWRWL